MCTQLLASLANKTTGGSPPELTSEAPQPTCSVNGGVRVWSAWRSLTVCLLIDGEGAEHVVGSLGSAEAAAPQHHAEGLWDTWDRVYETAK